ncbi:MAG: hypothetical protein MR704_14510 [Clostridia bacterium]|nr:hypothetical protein [Clostridia bacterium]
MIQKPDIFSLFVSALVDIEFPLKAGFCLPAETNHITSNPAPSPMGPSSFPLHVEKAAAWRSSSLVAAAFGFYWLKTYFMLIKHAICYFFTFLLLIFYH